MQVSMQVQKKSYKFLRNSLIIRSGWQDLNLRPHAPQTCTLPDCATPRFAFRNYNFQGFLKVFAFFFRRSAPSTLISSSISFESFTWILIAAGWGGLEYRHAWQLTASGTADCRGFHQKRIAQGFPAIIKWAQIIPINSIGNRFAFLFMNFKLAVLICRAGEIKELHFNLEDCYSQK